MAKMFYTLEEASEKLGVGEDEVRQMARDGKLQQFRDRDKLMFKREQVDGLSRSDDSDEVDDIAEAEEQIGLMASDDTDTISLTDDTSEQEKEEDPRAATGISVFDADEVEPADPMAQTQVSDTSTDEEELALECVGSGSGLLDLTRESDDTSLGAELLDDIYGGGEGSDLKLDASPGALEPTIAVESGPSGLENLQSSEVAPVGGGAMVIAQEEAYDGGGSGLGAGMLFVAMAMLIVGMIIAISAVLGVELKLTDQLAPKSMIVLGGGIAAAFVLGIIGFLLGKMGDR